GQGTETGVLQMVIAAAPLRRQGGKGRERRRLAGGSDRGGFVFFGRRPFLFGRRPRGRGIARGQVHGDRLDVTRGHFGSALGRHPPDGGPPTGKVLGALQGARGLVAFG